MTSMTLVPLCFVVYPIIAAWYGYYYYGDWHGALTAWAYFAMFQPFISYGSVRVTEISMDVLKSLPPLFVAVGVSGNYKTIVKLRKLRSALKKEVHYLIDEYGPSQYGDEWEGKYIMEMQEFNFTDIDDSEDEGGY